jgi:hypothetical protein
VTSDDLSLLPFGRVASSIDSTVLLGLDSALLLLGSWSSCMKTPRGTVP